MFKGLLKLSFSVDNSIDASFKEITVSSRIHNSKTIDGNVKN